MVVDTLELEVSRTVSHPLLRSRVSPDPLDQPTASLVWMSYSSRGIPTYAVPMESTMSCLARLHVHRACAAGWARRDAHQTGGRARTPARRGTPRLANAQFRKINRQSSRTKATQTCGAGRSCCGQRRVPAHRRETSVVRMCARLVESGGWTSA